MTRTERAAREVQLAALRDERAELVRMVLTLPEDSARRRRRSQSADQDSGAPATRDQIVDALLALALDAPGPPEPDPPLERLPAPALARVVRIELDDEAPRALLKVLAGQEADLVIVAPAGARDAVRALKAAAAAHPNAGMLLGVSPPERPAWLGLPGARLLAQGAPVTLVTALPAIVPAFAVRVDALNGRVPGRRREALRPLLSALAQAIRAAGRDVVRVPAALVAEAPPGDDAAVAALVENPRAFGVMAPSRRVLVVLPPLVSATADAHAAGVRCLRALVTMGIDAHGYASGEDIPEGVEVAMCSLASLEETLTVIPRSARILCSVDRNLPAAGADLSAPAHLLADPRVLPTPVSKRLRRHLRADHGLDCTMVLQGVDGAVFRPGGPDDHDAVHVVTFARSRPAERVAQIAEALEAQLGQAVTMSSWGAPVEVLIENGAPEGAWTERHHGPLRSTDLAALLQTADFVVDLEPNDPTGEIPLQAMACGAIPVVSPKGAGAELELVLTATTATEAAAAIAPLAADWRGLRAAQKAAGRAVATRDEFSTAVARYELAVRFIDQ